MTQSNQHTAIYHVDLFKKTYQERTEKYFRLFLFLLGSVMLVGGIIAHNDLFDDYVVLRVCAYILFAGLGAWWYSLQFAMAKFHLPSVNSTILKMNGIKNHVWAQAELRNQIELVELRQVVNKHALIYLLGVWIAISFVVIYFFDKEAGLGDSARSVVVMSIWCSYILVAIALTYVETLIVIKAAVGFACAVDKELAETTKQGF